MYVELKLEIIVVGLKENPLENYVQSTQARHMHHESIPPCRRGLSDRSDGPPSHLILLDSQALF